MEEILNPEVEVQDVAPVAEVEVAPATVEEVEAPAAEKETKKAQPATDTLSTMHLFADSVTLSTHTITMVTPSPHLQENPKEWKFPTILTNLPQTSGKT